MYNNSKVTWVRIKLKKKLYKSKKKGKKLVVENADVLPFFCESRELHISILSVCVCVLRFGKENGCWYTAAIKGDLLSVAGIRQLYLHLPFPTVIRNDNRGVGSEEKTDYMVKSPTRSTDRSLNAALALGEISLHSRAWEGHVLVYFPHPMMFFSSIYTLPYTTWSGLLVKAYPSRLLAVHQTGTWFAGWPVPRTGWGKDKIVNIVHTYNCTQLSLHVFNVILKWHKARMDGFNKAFNNCFCLFIEYPIDFSKSFKYSGIF